MTLHVTNRLGTVIGDAIRDILIMTAKQVNYYALIYNLLYIFFWWQHARISKKFNVYCEKPLKYIDKYFLRVYLIFILYNYLSECVGGHFGVDCRGLCSGHCEYNEPCDHVRGVCPGGCQNGYMDEYCNRCKKLTSLFLGDSLHIQLLMFNKLYLFLIYSLQNRKLWEKLFFTMFSRLQWDL